MAEKQRLSQQDKEIIKKMDIIETSLGGELKQNNSQLIQIKHYNKLEINTKQGVLVFDDVFITAERNKEGDMEYHFMWVKDNEKGEMTIEEKMMLDKDGKVYSIDSLKQILGNELIDINELYKENDRQPGRLNGTSKKIDGERDPEERAKQEEKTDKQKEVEESLNQQGQDLGLSNFKLITDNHLQERNPEIFSRGSEHAIAYSNKLGKFVALEKVPVGTENDKSSNNKEQWQINDKIEPAEMNFKTIYSLNEQGDSVETKVPSALARTNDPNKEIAYVIEPNGVVDIEAVDRMPCDRDIRISTPISVQGQGLEGRLDEKIQNDIVYGGKEMSGSTPEELHDLAHTIKEGENGKDDLSSDKEALIPGTEKTWAELSKETGKEIPELAERFEEIIKEEAKKAKVSPEEFKKHLKDVKESSLKEAIEKVQDEIAQEYGAPTRDNQ